MEGYTYFRVLFNGYWTIAEKQPNTEAYLIPGSEMLYTIQAFEEVGEEIKFED